MKRFLAGILVLILLLGQPSYALIMLPPPDGEISGEGDTSDPVLILNLYPGTEFQTDFPLLTIEPGASWDTLELPAELECATDTPNVYGYRRYWCPVVWTLPEEGASTEPGRVTITGTLTPGKGYELGEGVSPQVTISAVVAGEPADGPETLVRADANLPAMSSIPLNVDAEEYLSQLDVPSARCFTKVTGEYFFCPINWDYGAVNIHEPGIYTASGVPVLPAGFALPVDFQPFARKLCVMPGDRVDLSAAVFETDDNSIHCSWFFPIPESAAVRGEYAVGQGPWQEDVAGTYLNYNRILGDSLLIYLEPLELSTDYYFRLVYNLGSGEESSNTLHINLENKDFLQPEAPPPDFDIGGDRDGGDWGGGSLPDIQQPMPPTDSWSPPAAKPNPPLEIVTETSTALSGLRLRKLAQTGATVLFSKQGVAAELSSEFLLSLELADDRLLQVTLERPVPESFRLHILADGETLTDLPETQVRLPWEGEPDALACLDASETVVSDAVYEAESRTVMCLVTGTGDYTLQAKAAKTEENATVELLEENAPAAGPELVFTAPELPEVPIEEPVMLIEQPQEERHQTKPHLAEPAPIPAVVPAVSAPAAKPEAVPDVEMPVIQPADASAAIKTKPISPPQVLPAPEKVQCAPLGGIPAVLTLAAALTALATGVVWVLRKRYEV